MKSLSLCILMSLSFSVFGQDLKHEAFCQSEAVKSAQGETRSCSLVFTINKAVPQSAVKCTGIFMNVIPCNVTYTIGNFYSSTLYSCGSNPLKPLLKQTITPEVTAYNVAAVVTRGNYERDIVNDPSSYLNLSGHAISISVETSNNRGFKKQLTAISLKLDDWIELTDIVCN